MIFFKWRREKDKQIARLTERVCELEFSARSARADIRDVDKARVDLDGRLEALLRFLGVRARYVGSKGPEWSIEKEPPRPR